MKKKKDKKCENKEENLPLGALSKLPIISGTAQMKIVQDIMQAFNKFDKTLKALKDLPPKGDPHAGEPGDDVPPPSAVRD